MMRRPRLRYGSRRRVIGLGGATPTAVEKKKPPRNELFTVTTNVQGRLFSPQPPPDQALNAMPGLGTAVTVTVSFTGSRNTHVVLVESVLCREHVLLCVADRSSNRPVPPKMLIVTLRPGTNLAVTVADVVGLTRQVARNCTVAHAPPHPANAAVPAGCAVSEIRPPAAIGVAQIPEAVLPTMEHEMAKSGDRTLPLLVEFAAAATVRMLTAGLKVRPTVALPSSVNWQPGADAVQTVPV